MTIRGRFSTAAVVVALGAFAAGGPDRAGVVAAQTPGQAPPVFRSGVSLVRVDVSVLDRQHQPVRGLAASDFTILENGIPQEVATFAAIDVPGPERGSAPWLREIAPDVRSNALGDGRLFALVIDDATMPFEARTLANVRRVAHEVFDRLGPADLAAVIYTRATRRSVDFTNDRARLMASVSGAVAGSAYTDPQTDNWSYLASIRTLGQMTAYLATVPHRRKALIYVSTGVPVDPSTVAGVTVLSTSRVESTLEESTAEDLVNVMTELVSNRPEEANGSAMHDALVRAQHGNVNIYSVDPAGLGGLQQYLEQRTTAQQRDRVTRAAPGTVVRADPLDAMQRAQLSRDFLKTVAATSGGRAILDTNDIAAGVDRIFHENSSYYLLAYRSTREPGDRRVRQVRVEVRRPGVTAQTRNAYYDPQSRATRPDLPAPFQLASALAGVLPTPNLGLRVTAAPFAAQDRRSATVAIVVGVQHPVPGDVGARVAETLRLEATALTPRGEVRGTSSQVASAILRSGTADGARYEVLTRLALAPGRYQLRVAAHSTLLATSGSVYVDVEVPAFGEALQLSGLLLAAEPGWRAVPAGALADVIPVVPTTVREFTGSDDVSGFVRVYDRSRRTPIAMHVRVADERGAAVVNRSEPVPFDRFGADGALDYRVPVPVSTLAPGRYLLTIEAAAGGRTIARHARFDVR